MQTYKISTLGESFIFIIRHPDGSDRTDGEAEISITKSRIIEIKADLIYDYRVSTSRAGSFFLPDLMRAMLIFLYRIKGLPKSEYEIIFDGDSFCKRMPYDNFGGNVGKCKLLFSKHLNNDEECDADFHFIEAPQGNYAFVICDKPEVADMKKITARALLKCQRLPSVLGACALSYTQTGASLRFHPLDNADSPHTSAYAAAAFLIKELFCVESCVIKAGNIRAECYCEVSGVRVYDSSPTVHKIY